MPLRRPSNLVLSVNGQRHPVQADRDTPLLYVLRNELKLNAAYFGCVAEIAHARTIVERGTSADRQLARYEAVEALGGSEQAALIAVVDGIMEETLMTPPGKPSALPASAVQN